MCGAADGTLGKCRLGRTDCIVAGKEGGVDPSKESCQVHFISACVELLFSGASVWGASMLSVLGFLVHRCMAVLISVDKLCIDAFL